jgi:integrase
MGKFENVIDEYLAYLETRVQSKDIAPSTQESWKRALLFAGKGMGFLDVGEIDSAVVQEFLDAISDFPGKQTTCRAALKAFEKWAIVRRKIPHPITFGTQVIGSDGGHEPWTDAQVSLAIHEARQDLAHTVNLAVETGQRGSDIVKMRWSDISVCDGRSGISVTQQKTGRGLWIPLTSQFVQTLSNWEKKPPFFLVLAPDGRQYSRNRLSHEWALERDSNPALVGLRGKVLHGLRATTVIRLRRLGFTELEISSYIGMSEPMVARYSRMANQQKSALATVERIENLTEFKSKSLQEKLKGNKGPTF